MKFLLFFFFFIASALEAQSHYLGYQYEPFLFITNNNYKTISGTQKGAEANVYLTSFYVTYKFMFDSTTAINTKIGFLNASSEEFKGFEMGGMWQHFFSRKSYFKGGLLFHYNAGTKNSSSNIKRGIIVFVSVAPGIKISDFFYVELQYLYPVNKNYGISMNTAGYPAKDVLGVLKFCLGFEFKL